MQKRLLVAVILISISSLIAIAQVDLPKPMPGSYVHDFAGVVAEDKKAEIQAKAQRLKDEYKTEIALVTIDSLQGEDSFDYSMRMARSWGIGSPDNDIRGILILVAVKDRKTSFRTSRHVEGEIPDAVTNDVSQTMNGYFKGGDFGGGLSAGLDKILARLQGAYEPTATDTQKQSKGWVWFWLILWAGVAISIVVSALRKKRRERSAAQQGRANFYSNSKPARPNPAHKHSRSHKRRPAARNKHAKSKASARPSESSTSSPSYDSGYSSSSGSSSSYDSGSSSGQDSGPSYSGGSDFGGGGSDSGW